MKKQGTAYMSTESTLMSDVESNSATLWGLPLRSLLLVLAGLILAWWVSPLSPEHWLAAHIPHSRDSEGGPQVMPHHPFLPIRVLVREDLPLPAPHPVP